MLMALLEKLNRENNLSREEIIYLLTHLDDHGRDRLLRLAHETRVRHFGRKVLMRGLIEFSSICRRNCMYCGLRTGNPKAARYRLTPDEIVQVCEQGYHIGYRTFVLQSGEDAWFTADIMAELISRIRTKFTDAAITLSIGERSYAEYVEMFRAGANRFLMRHETASAELYRRLHPGMTFENRVRCLTNLKAIGFQVGAGFMVGLPGQRVEDYADDLRFLHDFQPDMIGVGPLIPHSQTPLATERGGSVSDTLTMVALTRLMVPTALLPATTALSTLVPDAQVRALQSGANVVMPKLTPAGVRQKYQLYERHCDITSSAEECQLSMARTIQSAGLEVDLGRGDSLRLWPGHERPPGAYVG